MKKINFTLILSMIIAFIIIASDGAISQPPPPPDGHGLNGNQGSGGSAGLEGGSLFLLLSSGGYGIYKIFRSRKNKEKIED